MGRRILAVVLGLLAGSVVITAVEAVSHKLYPLPEGLSPEHTELFKAYLASLPPGAFAMIILAHALGSLAGGAAATLIARRASLVPALVVGAMFLAAGIANLVMLKPPVWVAVVDLLLYLPAAYLGARLAGQGRGAAGGA